MRTMRIKKGMEMKIVNLIENTKGGRDCLFEHGLSFYVETKRHRLLVDTGASDAFIRNAGRLGIDLKKVDTVVISHGHYDHAGGVLAFAKQNSAARIWIQRLAKEAYYHRNERMEKYIGMDPGVKELPQIEWVDGNRRIDDEIFLFGGVCGRRLWPSGNRELAVKRGEEFYQDEFFHEQYVVLEEAEKKVLISGCAHNGILNILDTFREICGRDPDVVISGFHMRKKSGYGKEDLELAENTALELKRLNTRFYTGHCTGEIPYQAMKNVMGEQLQYVHSGDEILL